MVIFELFTLNNELYAIDDSRYIHRLDGTSWVLVASTNLPWISDPNNSDLNAIEFNNKVIVLSDGADNDRKVWSSDNLTSWAQSTVTLADGAYSTRNLAVYGNSVWIFSHGNDFFISTDGSNWEDVSTENQTVIDYQAVVNKNGEIFLFSSTGFGALYRLLTFGI